MPGVEPDGVVVVVLGRRRSEVVKAAEATEIRPEIVSLFPSNCSTQ